MKGDLFALLAALLLVAAGLFLGQRSYTYWLKEQRIVPENAARRVAAERLLADSTTWRRGPVDSIWLDLGVPKRHGVGQMPPQIRFRWRGCDTLGVLPLFGKDLSPQTFAPLWGKTHHDSVAALVRYSTALQGFEVFSFEIDNVLLLERGPQWQEEQSVSEAQVFTGLFGLVLIGLGVFSGWAVYRKRAERRHFLQRFDWLEVKAQPLTSDDRAVLEVLLRRLRSELQQWLAGLGLLLLLVVLVPYKYLMLLKLKVVEGSEGQQPLAATLGWAWLGLLLVVALLVLWGEYRTARQDLLTDSQRGVKIHTPATVVALRRRSLRAPLQLALQPDDAPQLAQLELPRADYPYLKAGDRVEIWYLPYSGALLALR